MGVEMEDLPDQMSLTALAKRCMSEVDNYRRKEPYDDQYCLAIFHRALLQNDGDAWRLLVDRFSPMVMGWVRSHPRRDIACRYDSEDNYVAKAFGRFWQAAAYNQEIRFTSLAAALSYLKTCLTGAMLDTLRSYARPELSLNDPDRPLPEEPGAEDDTDEGHELWSVIKSLLPGEREQRLAYLLFHCGLKAREVVQFCGQEFSDVNEVYRLRRNIIEKLMRNRDQIRWRLSVDEQ
jgi:DNA-directed RNA polymerase specialized sigma24 family protein